jgi:hypothetical protein
MKELFDFLAREHVTPNGLYVLWATSQRVIVPGFVNQVTEQRRLLLAGFLREEPGAAGVTYPVTDKGLHLVREATRVLETHKRVKKHAVPFAEWQERLQAYVALFPAGKQGAQPIRTNPRTLFDRFKWFFATYPEYGWDTALAATAAYIRALENSAEGMRYISTAKYFVKKEDRDRSVRSPLADWCMALEEGSLDDISERGHRYFGSNIV